MTWRRALLALLISLASAGHVWAEAGDPLPSPLRLDDVRRLARAGRAEVAAVRARARAAAERPAIVSGLEDPVIAPSIDHLPFMLHGVDASLTIEQSFPLSRIRGHRRRAAEADAARARAEVGRTTLDVELQAVEAFLMLHERRRMAQVLEEQRALAAQLVAAANARYSGGTGSQSDVLRAEVEVARLEGARGALAGELEAAEAMLNASLGRPADASIPPLDSPARTDPPPSWAQVRDRALGSRPELTAGRAEVRRARADVDVMRSMYAPMAMVRVGPSYTMADKGGVMAMVGFSIPLWVGRLRAGVREAEAMVDMSQADLVAMRRMVEGEARAARGDVAAARTRFLALQGEVLPRARQAIDATLAGYSAGQLPLVSVTEAARAVWDAQAELVGAELELGQAWARLRRAMGESEERRP